MKIVTKMEDTKEREFSFYSKEFRWFSVTYPPVRTNQRE
jgi:hypothetical protein